MALTSNLVAWWKLNEASGTRNDSVGSNHLTDNNTVLSAFGRKGYAADFERSNSESLSITDNTDLSTGDISFTFAAWVQAETLTTGQMVLAKDNGSAYEFALYFASDRYHFYVENGGSSADVVANNFGLPSTGLGARNLIVCWHDATNNQIGIQVNNGTANTAAHSGGVADTLHPFRIGADGTGAYWDGPIDEVAFWKQALDATDRTALWNQGVGLRYEDAIGTPTVTTVFAHNASGAAGYESWPAVEALSATDLLCVFSDGSDHEAEDFVVKSRASADGGATWGSTVTINDETGSNIQSRSQQGAIWRDPDNGSLLSVFGRVDNNTTDVLVAKLKRSTNSGASWSAWGDLTVPAGYDWCWPYGRITKIGSDLFMPAYAQVTATGRWNSLLMTSDDAGQTWALHGVIAAGDGSHQYSETAAVQISGSDWLAVIRDETTADLWYTTSDDGGATWDTLAAYLSLTAPTAPAIFKASDTQLFIAHGDRQVPYAIQIWELLSATDFGGPNLLSVQASSITGQDFGYPSMVNVGGILKYAYYAPTGGADETSILFDTTGISVPPLEFQALTLRRSAQLIGQSVNRASTY